MINSHLVKGQEKGGCEIWIQCASCYVIPTVQGLSLRLACGGGGRDKNNNNNKPDQRVPKLSF